MLEKSTVEPSPVTGFPGINFRLEGFGVGAVLMKRNLMANEPSELLGLLAISEAAKPYYIVKWAKS